MPIENEDVRANIARMDDDAFQHQGTMTKISPRA